MQGSPGTCWGFDHRWTWLRIRFGMKIGGEHSGESKGEALLWTKWGFGGVVFPLTRSPRFCRIRFSIKSPFQRRHSRPRTAPMTSPSPHHAIFGIRNRFGTTIPTFLAKVGGVDFRPSLKNAGRVLREDRMRALFIQGQQVNFAVFINIKEISLSKRSLYR